MTTSHLPPIEQWWPRLDIPAKRWLLAHDTEVLPAHILAEISTICAIEMPNAGTIALSDAERNYINTQMESVD
jgi:hypothetical protein